MKINNKLKNLFFYFCLLVLTGCNGFRKARLGCVPKKASDRVDKEQDATSNHTQKGKAEPPFCITALLGDVDKRVAQLVENVLVHVLKFEFDIPNATPNCPFDSIHQKIADTIWGAVHTILSAFLKQNAKKLREFAYACYFDPDFMNSLTAPFEATSNASHSSAEINHNFNFMEFLGFCKKVSLARLDNYNASLSLHFLMYAFDFRFDMPDAMPNGLSDSIHQIMAGFILYMIHIVFKAVLKENTAKVRKFAFAYCTDPDFVNSVSASCQAIGNVFYPGVVSGVRFGASIGKSAINRAVSGISYGALRINDFANRAINTIHQHNSITYGSSL